MTRWGHRPRRLSRARILVVAALIAACTAQPGATTAPDATGTTVLSSVPTSAPAATTSLAPQAEHRIGVRLVDGEGEFYDRETGEKFVPRGANLIRLSGGAHSTLNPSQYDAERIEATFQRLAADGYNVVRVFLNSRPGGLPGSGDESLSSEYLDNAADLLARARAYGLQVMFTQDWTPESPAWSFESDPMIENVNALYLSEGGVQTNLRFVREWITGLVERGAAFDALLAYELRNELYFTELYPPFSMTEGMVRTANGGSYDMSSSDEKRQMLEDNLIDWVDRNRAAILELDPTALVTVGFFQPKTPVPTREGDDRIIETARVIADSTADFIDLHGYPGGDLNLGQLVENYGLPPVAEKPVILGEFGAEHGPFPRVSDAVRALVNWQVESCDHGFDGWLLWTWDTSEQPEFWTAVDSDGEIEKAFSPSIRPDPCVVGDIDMPVELSHGAAVTASASIPGSEPGNAVDGLADILWSAGDDVPQWLEIDLGSEHEISEIRMLVSQFPEGPTAHRVGVRGESGGATNVAELVGETVDGQWLEIGFDTPLSGVRFIRIDTVDSPSWVAWREVVVLGPPPA